MNQVRNVFILGCLLFAATCSAAMNPKNLRCEYLVDPLGIDATQPRLSWVLDSNQRGETQTAYQILAASSAGLLRDGKADLWDSGKVDSDANSQIVYGGQTLVSREDCFWQVRVWDQAGRPGKWSPVAHWQMGLLEPSDWMAKWIAPKAPESSPLPCLRKDFGLNTLPQRAVLYVTALGLYEVHIDGRRVGDHILAPD
jgi:alpha-L-rhamnosidase